MIAELGVLYPSIILLLLGIMAKAAEKKRDKAEVIIEQRLVSIEGEIKKMQRPITVTETDIQYMKENDKRQDERIKTLEIEVKRNSDEFKIFKQEVREEFEGVKLEVQRAATASNALSETGENMITTWTGMCKIWEASNKTRLKEQKEIMRELKKITSKKGDNL